MLLLSISFSRLIQGQNKQAQATKKTELVLKPREYKLEKEQNFMSSSTILD